MIGEAPQPQSSISNEQLFSRRPQVVLDWATYIGKKERDLAGVRRMRASGRCLPKALSRF